MPNTSPLRRVTAETLGSALLAALVVGSGIAAQTLSPSDVGLQLAENALATAAGLYAIILIFGPVSGAHLNPVVSLADAAFGSRPWSDVVRYVPAQLIGCILGAILANLMFGLPAVAFGTNDRASGPHFLAEVVATAGLVMVIFSLVRSERPQLVPAAVGAYIGAAYFFTSSTSFANPAITVGRMFTDSFAGIAPAAAPLFIAAQLLGGFLGYLVIRALYGMPTPTPGRMPRA